jgi:hypothetical protein
MDIKQTTDRAGRPAHDVAGAVKVYDEQEAIDLTVTGVFPTRAWVKMLGQFAPPPAVVPAIAPNGHGKLEG